MEDFGKVTIVAVLGLEVKKQTHIKDLTIRSILDWIHYGNDPLCLHGTASKLE